MPEQKGFKQALLRFPTRVLCLVLLALVAVIAMNAVLYSPILGTGVPQDFYVIDEATNTYVIDWSVYESDIHTLDQINNVYNYDYMKIGIIAGSLVGALVLAWFVGWLPKKLPLWVFPIIGGAVAFLLVDGLQLAPAGEGAMMAKWMEQCIWNGDFTFVNSTDYLNLINNEPYSMGYLLFLYPVMYAGGMALGQNAFINLVWLQYVNAILLAIAVYMLLRAANRLFGKTAAQVAGMLSVAFLPLAMFSVALTPEIPALFFAAIAIERTVSYLKNEKRLGDGSIVRFKKNGTVFNAILISLCMVLAVILKSTYVVLAVAMAILFLLDLIRNGRIKNLIPLIVSVALVAVVVMGYYPAAMICNGIFANYYAPAQNSTAANLQNGFTNTFNDQMTYLQAADTSAFYNALIPQWIDPSFGMISGIMSHLKNAGGLYIDVAYVGPVPLYLFYSAAADGSTVLDAYLASTVCNVVMNIIYVFAIVGLLVCVFRASLERLLLPLYALGGIFFHYLFGFSLMSGIPYMLALVAMAGYGLAFIAGLLHSKKRRDDPLSTRKKPSKYRKLPRNSGAIETAHTKKSKKAAQA